MAMVFSLLSGCGGTAAQAPITQAPTAAPAQSDSVESGDSKILIVCFAVAEKSDADAVSSASVAVDDNEAMVGNISRIRNQKR